MTGGDSLERAAALRQQFDDSFARAPDLEDVPLEDLLTLTAASTVYFVRLVDVSALLADTKVTSFPSVLPGLLGITGLRGDILPVYDLATLLGHADAGSRRWLVVTARSSVGLAFDRFLGHLRVRRNEIVPMDSAGTRQPHVRHVVATGDGVRPVVDVASILNVIESRVRDARQLVEQ